MANEALDTQLLDRAIIFAVRAHAGTERRGKGFPYIVHPMEAVEIVATMTADQELLAAAALHDTVEDTDITIEQIRAEFGDRVASLVAAESESSCNSSIKYSEIHVIRHHNGTSNQVGLTWRDALAAIPRTTPHATAVV